MSLDRKPLDLNIQRDCTGLGSGLQSGGAWGLRFEGPTWMLPCQHSAACNGPLFMYQHMLGAVGGKGICKNAVCSRCQALGPQG